MFLADSLSGEGFIPWCTGAMFVLYPLPKEGGQVSSELLLYRCCRIGWGAVLTASMFAKGPTS